MALPEPPPAVQLPPARFGGCLLWTVGIALVIVVLVQAFIGRLAFPPMPPLHRPVAVIERTISVRPEEDPVATRAQFSLTGLDDVLEAAEHTVQFELDFEADVPAILAGVVWFDRAEAIEPMGERSPATDVRWTVVCDPDGASCDRVVEIRLGAVDGTEAASVDIAWRLTAELRPPRGTELPDDAAVELVLIDGDPSPEPKP